MDSIAVNWIFFFIWKDMCKFLKNSELQLRLMEFQNFYLELTRSGWNIYYTIDY